MNNVFKHKRQNKSRSSLSCLPRDLYTKFVENVFLCFSIDVQDYECLGVASIFKNLVMLYPAICLSSISSDMYTKFVENLKRLTCAFGTQAALEEEVGY